MRNIKISHTDSGVTVEENKVIYRMKLNLLKSMQERIRQFDHLPQPVEKWYQSLDHVSRETVEVVKK